MVWQMTIVKMSNYVCFRTSKTYVRVIHVFLSQYTHAIIKIQVLGERHAEMVVLLLHLHSETFTQNTEGTENYGGWFLSFSSFVVLR